MPKADTLARIADFLDVSVDYLLGRQTASTTSQEDLLLDAFRACSDSERIMIYDLAKLYADRHSYEIAKRG